MVTILNILIASSIVVQAALCIVISLSPHEDTKNFTTTTTELLSSFEKCIVYIFDFAYESDYDSLASTKYIRFYSEYLNCAVFVETGRQYRSSTVNERFNRLEPHPVFTKYSTTLVNLYTPDTTSTILKKKTPILMFYSVMVWYNISFNYILIFMSNAEFVSTDSVGLFCKLATLSSPAVFLLMLDEREVSVIGFAHAFQSAPFLFKVTKFQESHIQKLHEIVHKDLQGAISRNWFADRSWEKCRFGMPILTHPHLCTLAVISAELNMTFLNKIDHPEQKSISEIVLEELLSSELVKYLSRYYEVSLNFVPYAVHHEEYDFICIVEVNTVGLMAFIQAFDLLTWIVAVAFCLSLSAAIAAMETKTVASFWTKLQSSVPVVLMLLIERFYGYGKVIRSASRQIGLVITLWAFGAMLLGMSYSGNMISELTSPSLPSCPHSMLQLAQIEDYPLLTDLQILEEEVWVPYFHLRTNEYLAEYANSSGSLTFVLLQFLKILTFVGDGITQVIPSNQNSSSKILLAYVGLKEYVSAYTMWTSTRTRNLRVLRGGNLPFFNALAPMSVQGNFLGPIFQRILGHLCQCGIYKYWTDGHNARYVNKALMVFNQRQKRSSWIEFLRKSNLAHIWRNFNPELVVDEAAWNGMTLENLSAAFQVFGTCMLLAICVFIKERSIFQNVVYHLFKLTKNVPTVMNRIVDNFATSRRLWLLK